MRLIALLFLLLISSIEASNDEGEENSDEPKRELLMSKGAISTELPKRKEIVYKFPSNTMQRTGVCGPNRIWCGELCIRKQSDSKCEQSPFYKECFGSPITYAFVDSPNRPDVDRFKIFQRFPSCWQKLAPLLCHLSFPACKVINQTDLAVSSPLVQVLTPSRRLCSEALAACPEIELFSLSELAPCAPTWHNSPFSDQCEKTSTAIPVESFQVGECPPFTISLSVRGKAGHSANNSQFRPVIDQCYMNCRSIYGDKSEFWLIMKALIHGFMLLFSFTFWFYLSSLSLIYERSIVSYCIANSLFCNGVYNLIHVLGTISLIREGLLCKDDILHFAVGVNLCTMESVMLAFSVCALSLWLLSHFLFLFVRPSCKFLFGRNSEIAIGDEDKLTGVHIRPYLFGAIYGFSAFFGIAIFLLTETDEWSGVCQPGMKSFLGFVVLMMPNVLFSCITFGIIYRINRRRKVARQHEEALIEDDTQPFVFSNGRFGSGRVEKFQKTIHDKRTQIYSYHKKYAITIIFLLVVCTLLAGCIHYLLIDRPSNWEAEKIREIMLCQTKVFFEASVSSDCLTTSDAELKNCLQHFRPLSERLSPNETQLGTQLSRLRHCHLPPSTLSRILSASLLVFSLLPNIVFIPLIIATLYGICGKGGIHMIRQMRPEASLYVLFGDSEIEGKERAKRVRWEDEVKRRIEGNSSEHTHAHDHIRNNYPVGAHDSESSCGSSLHSSFVSNLLTASRHRFPSHERIDYWKETERERAERGEGGVERWGNKTINSDDDLIKDKAKKPKWSNSPHRRLTTEQLISMQRLRPRSLIRSTSHESVLDARNNQDSTSTSHELLLVVLQPPPPLLFHS